MRLENVQGWSRGSVTEEELLKMTFEVSHCFEKKGTWQNYYEYSVVGLVCPRGEEQISGPSAV